MIVGIGVDIVDISRVESMLGRYGDRFLERVFTEEEAAYALRGVKAGERLSGRFAVKEAVMKALGTGKAHGILWRDVETLRAPSGKPVTRLHGKALERMREIGGTDLHVTIAHDAGKALAYVIIEGRDATA